MIYQDGARTSNGKVPSAELGGLDGDDPVCTFIEAQDRTIAERSGKPARPDQDHRPLAGIGHRSP